MMLEGITMCSKDRLIEFWGSVGEKCSKNLMLIIIASAFLGAVTGATLYSVALKDCYKEVIVNGTKTYKCKQKLSCSPRPPWYDGCPI